MAGREEKKENRTETQTRLAPSVRKRSGLFPARSDAARATSVAATWTRHLATGLSRYFVSTTSRKPQPEAVTLYRAFAATAT